jgi:flagellar FliL protein
VRAGGICTASRLLGRIELHPDLGGRAMADNDDKEDGAAEAAAAPKKSRKKLIMMAAAVLLLAAGGGATWFFFFRAHGEEMRAEVAAPKPPIFVDVPEVLVNLVSAPGERIQYLKVKVVLEVREEKQVETIKPAMPRVSDIFQTYMRELRPADLNGSAGLFRLKEELTRRVNVVVAPGQVNAVLFKEIVIQ